MKTQYTTDIWLATFLVRLGHTIVDVDTKSKRARIGFELDDEAWTQAKIQWMNSKEMDIKYTQEKIKDLMFQ